MWNHQESIETTAAPTQIWKLFSDVEGWKSWNAGIESIQLHGPFVAGTTFSMKPPGEEAFTSTLIDVRENQSFTDETVIDQTRVIVRHEITPLDNGNCRITYSTEISGAAAAEFGPMVTGDFAHVLNSLKRKVESSK